METPMAQELFSRSIDNTSNALVEQMVARLNRKYAARWQHPTTITDLLGESWADAPALNLALASTSTVMLHCSRPGYNGFRHISTMLPHEAITLRDENCLTPGDNKPTGRLIATVNHWAGVIVKSTVAVIDYSNQDKPVLIGITIGTPIFRDTVSVPDTGKWKDGMVVPRREVVDVLKLKHVALIAKQPGSRHVDLKDQLVIGRPSEISRLFKSVVAVPVYALKPVYVYAASQEEARNTITLHNRDELLFDGPPWEPKTSKEGRAFVVPGEKIAIHELYPIEDVPLSSLPPSKQQHAAAPKPVVPPSEVETSLPQFIVKEEPTFNKEPAQTLSTDS